MKTSNAKWLTQVITALMTVLLLSTSLFASFSFNDEMLLVEHGHHEARFADRLAYQHFIGSGITPVQLTMP